MKLIKSLAERLSGSIFGKSNEIAIEIVTYEDGSKTHNRVVEMFMKYACGFVLFYCRIC